MPGVGVGGLISNMLNPGLDQQLARAITPNPNPLAQGQPGAPTVDQLGNPSQSPQVANLAPAAVTQPDPINSSYAELLLKAHRNDQLSNDLNKNLAGVAAGFGTAQQQQSKTAALQGMGGPDDTLGALAKIQGMQDVTRDDNEHARFMASAHTFAQTLSQSLNRPVSDQEAATIMNSPDLMKAFGSGAGATASHNAETTNDQKNFNAARAALTESLRRANPNMSPEDIQKLVDARMPPDILAVGAGANAEDQAYYAYAAGERAAGRQPDDIITWKNQHASDAKEANATAVNIANAKKVLPGITTNVTNMSGLADKVLARENVLKGIFKDPDKVVWANKIMSADPKSLGAMVTRAQQSGGMSVEETQLVLDAQQLHNMDYRGAFAGEGGVKGIRSQVEADRVSRAADQLATFTDADNYIKNVKRLKGTYNSALANAGGEAQALEQIPESARYRLDPSYFSGGVNASKNLPEWAQVKTVNSQADWNNLANGQAYKAPGSSHGNRILIKGYEDQALSEDDG